MSELEDIFARIEAENRADEDARPAPDEIQVEGTYHFLKRWAKGKPIVRQDSGATFWACGKLMTKIDYKMALALAESGFASLVGDPRKRGATLKMIGEWRVR